AGKTFTGSARSRVVGGRAQRQRRAWLHTFRQHHADIEPGLQREPGQHEAVAAVVAATTGNHDPSRLRPAFAKYPPGGRTGALHQHIAVASEHGGGLLVDPAGGARVEQQGGGRRHGPILSPRQGGVGGGSYNRHMSPTLPASPAEPVAIDLVAAARRVRELAREQGFQRCGISGVDLAEDEAHLRDWLAQGLYGTMEWMARHGTARSRPQELVPGTVRVVSVGLDYGQDDEAAWQTLADGRRAYVARYALGRDYRKQMRNRLQKLAERLQQEFGSLGYRVFVDSAPVLERALGRNAGLGWIGKHTCLIDRDGGSWFFLGEIYLDLPLPVDPPASAHCGTCSRCIPACPTGAITAPHRLA